MEEPYFSLSRLVYNQTFFVENTINLIFNQLKDQL